MANFLFSNFKKWLKNSLKITKKLMIFSLFEKRKINHQVAKFRHNFLFKKKHLCST
jgi:hypothetical protein